MALARSKPATWPPFLPRSCSAYPSLYKTCATITLWGVCPSLCARRKIFTLIIWSVSRVSSNSYDSLFVGSSICWDCVWETVPLARSCGVALGAGSNSGVARPRLAGRESEGLGEGASLRDFADEDAISEWIIFVNFVKLGKLAVNSDRVYQVWSILTEFDWICWFLSFLPDFTPYIWVDS